MKTNIKKILLIISIIYSIIIIILMLYSYTTSTNMFEFKDDEKNIELLNKYKKELSSIEESDCKNSVESLISHYEKTSYNGKVNLKNKFKDDKEGLLNYAIKIINSCNLEGDVKSNIANKILTASIQFDEILQKLYFQYEIKIPDINNRLILEPNMNNVRYSINRKLQLEIIEELINVLKGEL